MLTPLTNWDGVQTRLRSVLTSLERVTPPCLAYEADWLGSLANVLTRNATQRSPKLRMGVATYHTVLESTKTNPYVLIGRSTDEPNLFSGTSNSTARKCHNIYTVDSGSHSS